MIWPESVSPDAYFAKDQYKPEALLTKILELVHEHPSRPRVGEPNRAAI